MNENLARTARYRKDEDREELLRRANALLRSVEQAVSEARTPERPVAFVVGPPQSATTLVSQLLAASGCFGIVSNFAARFFEAPSLGLLLERAIEPGGAQDGGFESEYGVTRGWNEPHEFGYFWNRWFDQGQETHKLGPAELDRVDSAGLQAAVARMEAVALLPMAFKNNTWCTFQVAFLRRLFPKSLWIVCQRHPFYNAQSIALGRRNRYGDINAWWSVRPAQHRELAPLPWWDQVAGQVRHTIDDMEEGLRAVDEADIVRIRYDRLCEQPGEAVARIAAALRRHGETADPVLPAQPFINKDAPQLEPEEFALLADACRRWFGSCFDGWEMPEPRP